MNDRRHWPIAAMLTCILLIFASGILPGAFAMSETGAIPLQSGEMRSVELSKAEQIYTFVPSANGQYAVCLLPDDANTGAHARIYAGETLVAEGEGKLSLLSARLNADTEYTLALTGSGSGMLEIARETLSRCFHMPLEVEDGDGYEKLIARSGDVHWYSITAGRSGAAIIAAMPEKKNLSLEIRLFGSNGQSLSGSDSLASGAGALSAAFTAGETYFVRVSARDGGTGKYMLSSLRSAVDELPEAVRLSETQLTLSGHASDSLRAETLPAGVCPLVLFTSSDPDVASIRPDGSIQTRSPGTATITAYAYGGTRAACEITVEEVEVEGVELSEETITLTAGEQAGLSVRLIPENASNRKITFVTENDRVAMVDERGTITAIAEGEARIVAVSEDGGLTDVLFVTVLPAQRCYRALLVGEQNYASTVDSVRPGSINSVRSIESLLKTASFGGEPFEITTLMDVPRDEVIAGIREAFAHATEDDVSLLYITCHGFYQAGMTFFVMADGSVLSALDLERELRGIPGEIVLLADCCGSGGLMAEAGSTEDILDGIASVFQGSVGGASVHGSKFKVVASALLDQDSYRISFSDNSEDGMATVFARALCDAAGWSIDRNTTSSMNADADYNGEITLSELGAYMSRRVMWYLGHAGDYVQTVRVYPEGDGGVVFARGE